jgi:hypothetical protein
MGTWFLARTGETLTLIRRTPSGRDVYGNTVLTEQRVPLPGCASWPETETEITGGRDTSITTRAALLPPGTVITEVDALEIGGVVYEMDGDPEVAVSPLTGTQGGVGVRVRRVTG